MSAQVTPFTGNYPSGKILQITVPATVSAGGRTYKNPKWEDNSTNPTRQVTITANTSLTVTYTIVIQHNLVIIGGTGGSVSPVPGTYVVDDNTSVPVTATAATDYSFAYWIVNGVAQPTLTNPSTSFTITADTSVQPYFTPNTINLTVKAGANGSVTLPDGTTVPAGGSVTKAYYIGTTYNFTATPNTTPYPGYGFGGWTGAVTSSANPLALRITSAMSTLTATFTATPYTTISMTVAKTGTGTVNPYGVVTLNVDPYTPSVFTATDVASSGYTFNHWVLPDGTTQTTRSISLIITTAMNNTTLTAVFTPIIYTLTINSTPIVGIPVTVTEMN